eukprot:11073999-Alexandrium_andersonii.AAC.1
MQHRVRHSDLELRGPRNGLEIGLWSSRAARSAALFAQIPNQATNTWTQGVRSCVGHENTPNVLQSSEFKSRWEIR